MGASSYVPWLPGDTPLARPIFRQPCFLTWLSSFTLEDTEAQRHSVTWPTPRVTVRCGQPTTAQWTPVAPIILIHTLTSTSWDRTFCGHPITVRSQEGQELGLEPGTWGFKSRDFVRQMWSPKNSLLAKIWPPCLVTDSAVLRWAVDQRGAKPGAGRASRALSSSRCERKVARTRKKPVAAWDPGTGWAPSPRPTLCSDVSPSQRPLPATPSDTVCSSVSLLLTSSFPTAMISFKVMITA